VVTKICSGVGRIGNHFANGVTIKKRPAENKKMLPAKRRKKSDRKSAPLQHVPEPPESMGEEGKKYWRSVAPQLIELGILTPLHLESFRVLCEQWQLYRTLTDWLDADPDRLYVTYKTGAQQQSPQVQLRERALESLRNLWMKFGLTPHGLAALGKHGGVAKKQLSNIEEFAKKKYED
jgi:P27 family predicted phage terminase small subunit